MGAGQVLIGKVLLTLLVTQMLTTAQPKPHGTNEDAVTHKRVRRFRILALGAAGVVGAIGVHHIKKRNPCTFHGWGITEKGSMEHKLAANKRCNDLFEKHIDELSKCPDAQSADCTEIDGDTRCAVHMADGSVKAIYDCA